MEGVPVDPKQILKGVEVLLGKDGGLCSLEGVPKMFSLMKASAKMVSRCMYLNILLHTKSHDVLNRFIRVGGYRLLNSWLTYSKSTNNSPLLQLILLTLQKLPLKVDHLKQNNTAKLVKQLCKSAETEELRKLASVLVDGWMATIRSQSVSSNASSPGDKKKKKEDGKVPLREVKDKSAEDEKKKDKAKAHAPSHAKIRSIGLEMDTPNPAPTKKSPAAPQLGDKYNIKPPVLKRLSSGPFDNPPLEKKYKPLNTPSNSTKEIKVKIIPAQPMECTGFLDALNSAPVPGIKIKKKKPAATSPSSAKAVSPTSNKTNPFDSKQSTYSSSSGKPTSPETVSSNATDENQEPDRPGTPVPTEDSDSMDTGDKPNALSEPRGEEDLTKKGKKKKTVHWAQEDNLKHYFYFDLDETERVNVNKVKDFGEAAKRELMMDRQTFEMARRLSHDAMEERVPWTLPRPLTLAGSLVIPGSNSTEKLTQRDREMGILQELFLSKESVPDTPHEPDPEPYEPMPPRLIPLDEDSSVPDDSYPEPMDTSQQVPALGQNEGSKLPPVLANLMGNLNSNSRSPQTTNTVSNPVTPAVNVQELLTSIMGASSNQSTEDLIKQPDFSDKIKQLLGSLQQTQNQNPGPAPVNPSLLGHSPMNNMNNMHMQMPMNSGFPPNMPPGGPRFNHPPPPHNHGPPFNSGGGPPRMMGPPPPGPPPGQGRGDNGNYWGDDSMRGGPHRGGHFHRGGRGRGGEPGFRGRGRGGPRGGHNMNDMSMRPVCRHFMMKGNCRYESNCAFYHPGVNGPPFPPNNQHGH
ncbi:serine/threonine-protein phosphatase 1 regulatory subunit 10 [Syngnathus scovelli]|uniref:serine/threonine-protein phosphatase 1 regulatory subunit 10 n=1 Tax=Syngnathus scovelli TaxID=161590 RepID=UPI002110C384|nr:serine/threonine-protein phosphatase 1 regulatory subunit 10 [Syngnathus scovelli]XP_049607256.1 serine/threonine-protein phosphatase 1 regulatory subunit 10 [Syngnathus scovelli]XP_049607257.1 serine/threonine-protein phosphatase 1 regulatory subunit 10 [Syngnathus scovelli]